MPENSHRASQVQSDKCAFKRLQELRLAQQHTSNRAKPAARNSRVLKINQPNVHRCVETVGKAPNVLTVLSIGTACVVKSCLSYLSKPTTTSRKAVDAK